jgi:hypothetical protein
MMKYYKKIKAKLIEEEFLTISNFCFHHNRKKIIEN